MKTFWKIFFGSLLGCIVALIILGFIGIGMLGSLASFTEKSEPVMPKSAILKLDFKAAVADQGSDDITFDITSGTPDFSGSISLLTYIRAIEAAANDPAIKFIYMTPETVNMGMAQTEEVRNALLKFRESGKPVIAYATQFSNQNYYLASVADKIYFNAFGDTFITGLGSSIIFFKDLLDKLGVEVQLIRHGKYKAAAEQFIKNDISPENREQNEVMLNSLWNAWCEEIAASRDFTAEEFNSWIDNLELTTASTILEKGLVDELCYRDQLEKNLCTLFDVKEEKDLKFIGIEDYAKIAVKSNVRAKDKIAVVYASGEIVVDGKEGNISGIKMAKTLADVRKDSTIKAVVFRVDSPGGSAQAAEMINREIGLLKEVKPVIASYGTYAASGGYWISARTDHIFTDNSTLTGSIGVFSMMPVIGGALKKNFKVNPVTISTNKHGDMMTAMRRLDSDEQEFMQSMVEQVYTQFMSLVSEGRNMTIEQVDEIAQGRVWAGSDALNIGLADEKGGLADAIKYAEMAAGLTDYRIVEYPVKKTAMEKLMETFSKTKVAVDAASSDPMENLAEIYSSLKSETKAVNYARLPYIYDIK
jgi:signal peptide peptidase SppA, 67K type